MKVKVISILEDNYMYLVIEEDTKRAIAVDPAVPHRLLEILRREGLSLTAVLTTHHHWNPVNKSNTIALQRVQQICVLANDKKEGKQGESVVQVQRFRFGSINVRCLFTPCHTSGHMCYFVWEDDCADAPAVFTGDTLFVAGCGKFFEGTAEQMHRNLTEVLGSLPKDTKVFCGHEYTIKNLKFALKVEPGNEKVKQMLSWARARDDDDKPTVPSTLSEEFEYNPFLRLSEESVQTFTGKRDPIEVLRVLRKEKDNFKKPKERAAAPHALLALEWGLL
uniref:Hydroxyacylglutathione hydrolase like n=1 Tax=Lepisosteus oculatus TaxID=7918 RepID=W5MCT8_LEPOC